MSKTLWSLLGGISLLGATVITQPVFADDDDDGIKIVKPSKKAYSKQAGNWWAWALNQPFATNPVLDNTGENCDLGQSGKVWYLAGTFGGAAGEEAVANRQCVIPEGKRVFFPLLNGLSNESFLGLDDACKDLGLTPEEEIRCDVNNDVADFIANASIFATINGEPVTDLLSYRAQSPEGGFTLSITEEPGTLGNAFGIAPGTTYDTAIADGYWLLLKGLEEGVHQISFGVDIGSDGVVELGANYEIIVTDEDDDEGDDD